MGRDEVSVHHPIFAHWIYPRVSAAAEARGGAEHRRELLAGLSGRVIEVGAGNGINFGYYPPSVRELVATEPESYLRSRATYAAETATVAVRIVDSLAESLPMDDASFDAGVTSLLLCSVADPARALAELFRVIRPGGELRFYEHVCAEGRALARLQRVVDATFWPLVAGGCHTSRESRAAIEQAGFTIERCRQFMFRPCALGIPRGAPHPRRGQAAMSTSPECGKLIAETWGVSVVIAGWR
jgi:SAM-dependent methyltransferase